MRRRPVAVQHPCPRCTKPCWGKLCRACHTANHVSTALPARTALQWDWQERKRRARVVQEWRAVNGDMCPGLPGIRPAHYSEHLTADHALEIALGGEEHGELTVLCRSCNSAKSNLNRAKARKATTDYSRRW
jgi:hypothetical protein